MFHFCTPWKRQKSFGFLTFLSGTEVQHWAKMGQTILESAREVLNLIKLKF